MFYFDTTYLLIVGPIFALSFYVQNQLKSKFKKFSKQPLSANLTGKEVAEKMLNDHGIYDVKIISVKGQLSDHYNPQKKTVNLSESVYSKSNTAAVAVAAHECGHAVQHAKGYEWLKMRSILVPMVGVSSNLGMWLLLGGIVLMQSSPVLGENLATIGILGFATGTLFSLVTLPVEFDASKRAIYWLERKRIVNQRELVQSKEALNWAAGTYVVAALASIANLVYLWFRFGRRN
ncbi:zinc metallopeptidase [Flavobacteriaceae bacterium]|nr:zinc metallopeptidase [Flavobacteriaceae bacterium]|tara:strand:+ start:58 stop:759 length:702 start_codon:yes stop_codon:yes gene_type:complete